MKNYRASIIDIQATKERADRLSSCGICDSSPISHYVTGDTIDELVSNIRNLNVQRYSEDKFLYELYATDEDNAVTDREVQLYWDGRGTSIYRGEYNTKNMTEYTSL